MHPIGRAFKQARKASEEAAALGWLLIKLAEPWSQLEGPQSQLGGPRSQQEGPQMGAQLGGPWCVFTAISKINDEDLPLSLSSHSFDLSLLISYRKIKSKLWLSNLSLTLNFPHCTILIWEGGREGGKMQNRFKLGGGRRRSGGVE